VPYLQFGTQKSRLHRRVQNASARREIGAGVIAREAGGCSP
jgi:hypothetical protein